VVAAKVVAMLLLHNERPTGRSICSARAAVGVVIQSMLQYPDELSG